jgi:hypothetical protein
MTAVLTERPIRTSGPKAQRRRRSTRRCEFSAPRRELQREVVKELAEIQSELATVR